MPVMYDEIYMRNLKLSHTVKDEDYLTGETKTGTKLFPVKDFKNFIYSSQVYQTLDELKNAKVRDGDLCYTMGYRNSGDGGGGMYYIKYDPTAIEDKGLIHDINTDNTLRAVLINGDNFINVHHFGAYGDGIHDDTKFIQSALNTGMSINFSSDKIYKITSALRITHSNQIINVNHATIVPYNCYAFSITGTDGVYVQNITFNAMNIRCNNNGDGIKISQYTKNIVFNQFNIMGINSNSKGFVVESSENVAFNQGNIYGTEYNGDAFILKSSDSQNRNRRISLRNIQVFNCDNFTKINFIDETTSLIFENCSFINDDMNEDNLSTAFYIDSVCHHISISNFTSWNVDTFMYTSSGTTGDISIRQLYVYDNRNIYNLNSLSQTNSVQLEGLHSYTGVNREPKNNIFVAMYSNLHNNASITWDEVSYDMIKSIANCPGKLYDHHILELTEEREYKSATSTNLNVDVAMNARYNWTGDLLLKNINGFEGQIIYVRSTTGQEISSGGNIILYPETPDISFKEAMKITPYKFKCIDGKWVKLDF